MTMADERIINSAKQDDRDALTRALTQLANIDTQDHDGRTAFSWAAGNGHIDIINQLVELGANIHIPDHDGRTPFGWAVANQQVAIINTLLDHPTNFFIPNHEITTLFMSSVTRGHTDLVRRLLDRGVDINTPDVDGRTAIRNAIENRDTNTINLLLERNANIDIPDNQGITPIIWAASEHLTDIITPLLELSENIVSDINLLTWAAGNGRIDIVNRLVTLGININTLDIYDMPPIIFAAANGHLDIVNRLIELDVDLEAQDTEGRTPLIWASLEGHPTIVNRLAELHIDIDAQDHHDRTAFSWAAAHGHLAIVNSLGELDVDTDTQDEEGRTPLSWAAGEGHLDVVDALVNQNVDFRALDHSDRMPLSWAAGNGHLDIVNRLAERRLDILAPDWEGRTALSWAAGNGHLDVVNRLIVLQADILAPDRDGRTALSWAAGNGHLDIINRLAVLRADILTPDQEGRTVLSWAAGNGHLNVVNRLAMLRADILAPDRDGRTVLSWAAGNGHLNVVNRLARVFVNFDTPDNDGRTALSWAAANGHIDIVDRLEELRVNRNTLKNHEETPSTGGNVNHPIDIVNPLDKLNVNKNTPDNDEKIPSTADTSPSRTSLSRVAEGNNWDTVVALIKRGAKINDLTFEQCEVFKKYLENSHHEETPQLLQLIEQRLSMAAIEHLVEFREQSESVGLEVLEEENSKPGCSYWRRKRRDLASCRDRDEQDRHLFPYDPLQEEGSIEQRHEARVYSQITLALAWRQGESPETLLRYQRNLGNILDEGPLNQSPRERRLLDNHYQQAQQFFQNSPQTTLLEIPPAGFEPLAGHSLLLEHGQQSLLVFNEGMRYQLYSPDLNYRYRFQSRPGTQWPQMSALIESFFQWKTGRSDYQMRVLKQNLPAGTLKMLQDSPFQKPEKLLPDSVLLARQYPQRIEEIPVRMVRELVRLNGQVVDSTALHADFFRQTAGIQLRVENLHTVLAKLNPEQQRAVAQVVTKYHWSASSTLLETLLPDEWTLFADYQQQVMTELTITDRLTPERLSELSFQVLNRAFKRADIPEALTQQALDNLKALSSKLPQRAWAKGMATQTLFFLPDMIREANTGQVGGLVMTAGMLSTDAVVNHSYKKLVEHLQPVLTTTRFNLLKNLPITSPVFKALTVYSTVELTQQLRSLPADSPQRQTIQHRLGEQAFTIGLIAAELLGFEVGPLWVGLIAEQLIFEAITFRKENQLNIPFWEAFIMTLGFEQDKLQHILEERDLVDLSLDNLNRINDNISLPYHWMLVTVPSLGNGQWDNIPEDQVPPAIKQRVESAFSSFAFPSFHNMINSIDCYCGFDISKIIESIEFVKEAAGFRRISFRINATQQFPMVPNLEALWTSFQRNFSWYRENYRVQATEIKVDWSPSHLSCQEDNIFLENPNGGLAHYQRIASVTGKEYGSCLDKTPVKISGPGLAALYRDNHNLSNQNTQRNLHFGFDPREGNITLLIQSSGLQALDEINRRYNANYSRYSNHSYSLTVQVGPKGYPPSILFEQPVLGMLTVEERSRRLDTSYFINSNSEPFYLYDDAMITKIAIHPPRDRRIGFIVHSDLPNIIYLQTWMLNSGQLFFPLLAIDKTPESLKKALKALLPQRISILYFPKDKKYLQLMLEKQQIIGALTLSAERVEVLCAQGQDAYRSIIIMTSAVASFTVTLQGRLQIQQGHTQLFLMEGKPADNSTVCYSKQLSVPNLPLYQLELDALQPVLNSLYRTSPQKTHFFTAGLGFVWVSGLENQQPATLKVIGLMDGRRAQLLLEHNRTILSHLDENTLNFLAVDHDTPQAELDRQWVFQRVITRERARYYKSPYSSLIGRVYPEGVGHILCFQSAQGHPVIHRFPVQATLLLNGIEYQVSGERLYAVGAPNGVINGDRLLRYLTSSQSVEIRVNSTLIDSELTFGKDSMTINQLTLRHLSNRNRIHFGKQSFTLRTLKSSHYSRQRRDLHQAEPLTSGTDQKRHWFSPLMKLLQTLRDSVIREYRSALPSWVATASPSHYLSILQLSADQQPPQSNQRIGEYTAGDLQGALQIAYLLFGSPHQPVSLQQQWVGFSSDDTLAADPYRGYRADVTPNPPGSAKLINSY
jgi:ankyrin repeat protein